MIITKKQLNFIAKVIEMGDKEVDEAKKILFT